MLQPLAIIAGMVEKVARHGVQNIVSSVFRKKIAVLFFLFFEMSNHLGSAFFCSQCETGFN